MQASWKEGNRSQRFGCADGEAGSTPRSFTIGVPEAGLMDHNCRVRDHDSAKDHNCRVPSRPLAEPPSSPSSLPQLGSSGIRYLVWRLTALPFAFLPASGASLAVVMAVNDQAGSQIAKKNTKRPS